MGLIKFVGFCAVLLFGLTAIAASKLNDATQLQSLLQRANLTISADQATLIFSALFGIGILASVVGAVLSVWQFFFSPTPLTEKSITSIFAQQKDVRFDTGIENLTPEKIEARPATLLIARYRVLPFDDRLGHKAETLAWCRTRVDPTASRDIRVRLISAGGGFGKTRLAIEVLKELKRQKWTTGFLGSAALASPDALACVDRLLTQPRQKGFCLAIDYAGIRPEQVGDLLDRLARLAEDKTNTSPVRILLLARQSEWWLPLAQSGSRLTVTEDTPYQLGARGFDLADRIRLYETAITAFAPALAGAGISLEKAFDEPPVEVLKDPLYNRPLTIAMAAFLVLRGKHIGDARVGLFDALIDLEADNWKRAEKNGSVARAVLENAAIQATLCGGALSDDDIEKLRSCDPNFDPPPRESHRQLMSTLSKLYPAEGDGGGDIGSVEPDILGEALLARAFDGDNRPLLTATFLRVVNNGSAEGLKRLLAVLIRMGHHPEKRTEAAVTSLLDHWSGDGVPDLSPQAAQIVLEQIPHHTLVLRKFAAALSGQSVSATADNIGDDLPAMAERARQLNNASIRFGYNGERPSALAASEEAVALFRELVLRDRDVFLPALAMSLNNLGGDLSAVGDRDGALAAAQEAVALRRELALRNRDAFLPDLAGSLNNLGNRLSDVGDRDGALAAAQEAVALRRELALRNRDAFLPNLAGSLNNLGNRLSAVGDRDSALAAAQEAVALRRELVSRNRDAFLPDLANSLSVLGDTLYALDKFPDAIVAYEESLSLLKLMMINYSDRFGGLYRQTIKDVSAALKANGLSDDAIAARIAPWLDI